ncbi:MAG: universal stress protein [Thermoleophilia bacterium]
MYSVIFVALKNDSGDGALLVHAARAGGGAPGTGVPNAMPAAAPGADAPGTPATPQAAAAAPALSGAAAPAAASPTLILAHAVHSHTRDATSYLRSDAEAYLDEVAGPLRAQGFHVQTLVVEGEPAEAIRGAAAESGAELIVMGSHGHSQVRHFLLGSVTEAVIRGSEIPVLVVRPGPGESGET